MVPSKKIKKTGDSELKAMIGVIQDMFYNKLQSIEEKIEKICAKYVSLEKKVDMIVFNIQTKPALNTIDFPGGSWLGDPDNPNLRLRCPITPKDLERINERCTTAKKMSLMLLDYLFPREVQACSNISGSGKHKKEQLDPNKINGIKYHVIYKFGISESDWKNIKLHIDSKCRAAFRRKERGLPLNIRGKRGRPLYKIAMENEDECEFTSFHESLNMDDQSYETRSDEGSSLSGVDDPKQIEIVGNSLSEVDDPKQIEIIGNSLSEVDDPIQIEVIGNLLSDEDVYIEEQFEVTTSTSPISTNSEMDDTDQHRFTIVEAMEEQLELLKHDPSIEIIEELPD